MTEGVQVISKATNSSRTEARFISSLTGGRGAVLALGGLDLERKN